MSNTTAMMRSLLKAAFGTLRLTLLLVVCTVVADRIVPLPTVLRSADPSSGKLFLLMSFAISSVCAVVVLRSRWRGLKLAAAVLLVTFGFQTFMTQQETILFRKAFPLLDTQTVLLLAARSLLQAIPFAPLAVLVLGRWKGGGGSEAPRLATLFDKDTAWKIGLLAALYPVVYYGFGFTAWSEPALREFYGFGAALPSVALVLPLQVARGGLWILCGLPLFVMFGRKAEALAISAFAYSILPSICLILPNPVMPTLVRLAHFREISLSMAVFGALAALAMTKKGRT